MKRIDDRPFLVILSVVLIAVILVCGLIMENGWFGYSSQLPVTPTSVITKTNADDDSQTMLVNINTASVALLDTLPRIGPALAERIVDYREQNGPFTEIEQLKSVKGIGEKTFEALRPYITIES